MITALCRTVILYFLIMIGLRLMGKRQIGELEPSELVLTMMISDLATVPMQDFGIPLLAGVIPILTLIGAEVVISAISLKSLPFRRLLSGKPVIIIENGVLNQKALKKLRLSIDDVLEDLRLKDVFDIREVRMAQVETNGQISILLNAAAQPVTAKMMSLSPGAQEPFHLVVSDGRFLPENLAAIGRSRKWLDSVMAANGAQQFSDVFFLCADKNGSIIFAGKEN